MIDRYKIQRQMFLQNKKLIDSIYDSIGTCKDCQFYDIDSCNSPKMEYIIDDCGIQYRDPTWYCADFKRKIDANS